MGRFGRESFNNMANMDKLAALVNSFGSAVLSVGREVGLSVALNKAKVSQGIKVENACAAALIGIVGNGARARVLIMLDMDGFNSIVTAMSGGMIPPNLNDAVSQSVIAELSNMVGGRALLQASLTGMDVTPPQMIVGDNIKHIPNPAATMKSFTLPFIIQPAGALYLALSFGNA